MQKEQIQEFTRRISQCNRTELTVVTYDILFAYLKDAKADLKDAHSENYKQNIRMAIKCIQQLQETLDFSYKLAAELYRIYVYCRELLAAALYKCRQEELDECESLLKKLYESFCEVARTDTSAPLMQNTQAVYAGYTYGRSDVNENHANESSNRGFLA